jgi:SAM-dependent methyltransferase
MRLYTELAGWFHLVTAPSSYAEEAAEYARVLEETCDGPIDTLLELGSGGGNNASHLKQRYRCTLTDLSPEMLAVSEALNPECEHVQGDMRTLRLEREFDAVLVHDAIAYMTTPDDLHACFATAFVHLRPGGAALLVPDYTRETFTAGTSHGGHDGDGRSLRYLAWRTDPDPADTTYQVDYAILMREGTAAATLASDTHLEGLFSEGEWLAGLSATGFAASAVPLEIADTEAYVGFAARRPAP